MWEIVLAIVPTGAMRTGLKQGLKNRYDGGGGFKRGDDGKGGFDRGDDERGDLIQRNDMQSVT